MEITIWFWVIFNAFVLISVALDLGVFHRKSHEVSFKEASVMVSIWVTLAVIFGAGVYYFLGHQKGIEFYTGYVIELSLSMDNIFVFVLIFAAFRVPRAYQHRVLVWGIIGALLLRGAMILIGTAMVEKYQWVMYVFGAFLVFTGVKMALSKEEEEIDLEKKLLVRFAKKYLRLTKDYHEDKFFVKQKNKWYITPLFLVLVLVDVMDVVFAVDSIPAIFAITTDPFIVYTANVFAIMGLRSMYFMLSDIIPKFHYLQTGLCMILIFIGVKMLIVNYYHIPTLLSLGVIIGVLGGSIVASVIRYRKRVAQGLEV